MKKFGMLALESTVYCEWSIQFGVYVILCGEYVSYIYIYAISPYNLIIWVRLYFACILCYFQSVMTLLVWTSLRTNTTKIAGDLKRHDAHLTTLYLYIIRAMASQITSFLIVWSGAFQRKYQSSASLACEKGIHHWPVVSRHKRPVTWKMFPFDDAIMPHFAIIPCLMWMQSMFWLPVYLNPFYVLMVLWLKLPPLKSRWPNL